MGCCCYCVCRGHVGPPTPVPGPEAYVCPRDGLLLWKTSPAPGRGTPRDRHRPMPLPSASGSVGAPRARLLKGTLQGTPLETSPAPGEMTPGDCVSWGALGCLATESVGAPSPTSHLPAPSFPPPSSQLPISQLPPPTSQSPSSQPVVCLAVALAAGLLQGASIMRVLQGGRDDSGGHGQ